MQLTSKLPNLETTIFTKMSALAKEHNALNLSQGFPNFQGDPKIISLVTKAMQEGQNQYAPMMGNPKLLEAISNKLANSYNVFYHPENEIMVTVGASQAIFSAITAFVHKDDEVIIFKPAYDCYEPAVQLNGGRVVDIQLHGPSYRIDWEDVKSEINPKTRMIIVNSPTNPTGTIFTEEDMLQLQEITKGTDVIILSDEVYEHMIYDGQKHQSAMLFPDLQKRCVLTFSFGKTFHHTGWKTGYCCAPKELMDEIVKVHMFSIFSVNHPVQIALAEYLNDSEHYEYLNDFYQQKRDLFLDLVKDSKFTYRPAQGTYFQILNYKTISDENDVKFAERLTKENGIASIPISVFNKDKLDNKDLRFCFAKKDDTLKRAAEILNAIE